MNQQRILMSVLLMAALYIAVILQFSLFPLFVGPYTVTVHLLLIIVLFCSVAHQYELAMIVAVIYAVLVDILGLHFFGFTFIVVATGVFVQLVLQEFWLRNRAYHTAVLTVAVGLTVAVVIQTLGIVLFTSTPYATSLVYSVILSLIIDYGVISIASVLLARLHIQDRVLFYER